MRRGKERVIVRAARVCEREKERCTNQLWREEKVEKEEEEEEVVEEKEEVEEKEKGMGDHHRNDRSDGLGRPSTTRDLPDVGDERIRAYSTVYNPRKGL